MAEKVKTQAKQKEQTQQQEQAAKVLAEVPEKYVFWCHDGRTLRSMKYLAAGALLNRMISLPFT